MKEKNVEIRLYKAIEKLGGWAVKFTSPSGSIPDRAIFMPGGKLWLVETKTTGKRQSPNQVVASKRLSDLGFPTIVIDTEEKLNAFLNAI